MKKKSLILLTLAASPAALAQYNATVGDLNQIYQAPMNLEVIVCQNALNEAGPREHRKSICQLGSTSARTMAEQYAAGAGKYLGCIDGMYQGADDGYAEFIKPSPEMWKAAQELVKNATFASADDRANKQAVAESKTESADQIVNRYREVVGVKDANGNQVLPDKSYKYPQIAFQGYGDGYEWDLSHGNMAQMDFTGPTNAGWINANTPFADRVAAAKAYTMRNQYSNICDNKATIFGRKSMRQLTIWDYFHQMDESFFKDYGWNNTDWAWDFFIHEDPQLNALLSYNGIKALTKEITVDVFQTKEQFKRDANGNLIPKKDANGNPVIVNGQPVYETEIVKVKVGTEQKIVPIDATDIANLQKLYKQGFVDSYRYYARQYASLHYNVEGMDKYKTGKLIGQLIGEEVARYEANKSAYNTVYQANSLKTYTTKFYKLYEASFDRLIGIFQSNPVVDMNNASLMGTTNDNIFRAGESLMAYYDITNLGEVTRPVTLSLVASQDVRANPTGFVLTPPVLDRMKGQTPVLGSIAPGLLARQSIIANLVLNNPSDLAEIKSSLRTTKGQPIGLNDYAEIDSVSAHVDPMTGMLTVGINLVNPSNVSVENQLAFPEVEITMDGTNLVKHKTVDKVTPGTTLPVTISTNELDPLAVITSRRISGTINVKLADRIVHTAKYSASVNDAPNTLLSSYFHKLVMGKATNTGGQNVQDRIIKLIGMINNSVDYVLSNDIIRWRKQHHVDRTIIADLQREYGMSVAAGELTPEAQTQYTNLAMMLAKKVNNKGQTRIRGLDKHYLKALKRFAPTISTKWRHYKQ